MYGGRIYVQYGLKEDTSLARNPVMRFYRHLRSRMSLEIEKVLSLVRGTFTIKSVPLLYQRRLLACHQDAL